MITIFGINPLFFLTYINESSTKEKLETQMQHVLYVSVFINSTISSLLLLVNFTKDSFRIGGGPV